MRTGHGRVPRGTGLDGEYEVRPLCTALVLRADRKSYSSAGLEEQYWGKSVEKPYRILWYLRALISVHLV